MQFKILYEAVVLNRSTKFLPGSSWPHTYSHSVSVFIDICLEKYIKIKPLQKNEFNYSILPKKY